MIEPSNEAILSSARLRVGAMLARLASIRHSLSLSPLKNSLVFGTFNWPLSSKLSSASIACDGKYLYVHTPTDGLVKLGSGAKGTTLGALICHKPEFALGQSASMALIGHQLYFRSPVISPASFQIVRTNDLEIIENAVSLDGGNASVSMEQNSPGMIIFSLDSSIMFLCIVCSDIGRKTFVPRSPVRSNDIPFLSRFHSYCPPNHGVF